MFVQILVQRSWLDLGVDGIESVLWITLWKTYWGFMRHGRMLRE